jgi:hypothetical protein
MNNEDVLKILKAAQFASRPEDITSIRAVRSLIDAAILILEERKART